MEEKGRPTMYTKELANKICLALASGKSLREICKADDMPAATTVHQWVLEEKKEIKDNSEEISFSKQYARAREIQAENMFDEILEIADDSKEDLVTVQFGKDEKRIEDREVTSRSRLRVDTRKWYLSKVLPKKFGEKVDVTTGGEKIKGNTIIFKDFKDETDSEQSV